MRNKTKRIRKSRDEKQQDAIDRSIAANTRNQAAEYMAANPPPSPQSQTHTTDGRRLYPSSPANDFAATLRIVANELHIWANRVQIKGLSADWWPGFSTYTLEAQAVVYTLLAQEGAVPPPTPFYRPRRSPAFTRTTCVECGESPCQCAKTATEVEAVDTLNELATEVEYYPSRKRLEAIAKTLRSLARALNGDGK